MLLLLLLLGRAHLGAHLAGLTKTPALVAHEQHGGTRVIRHAFAVASKHSDGTQGCRPAATAQRHHFIGLKLNAVHCGTSGGACDGSGQVGVSSSGKRMLSSSCRTRSSSVRLSCLADGGILGLGRGTGPSFRVQSGGPVYGGGPVLAAPVSVLLFPPINQESTSKTRPSTYPQQHNSTTAHTHMLADGR